MCSTPHIMLEQVTYTDDFTGLTTLPVVGLNVFSLRVIMQAV